MELPAETIWRTYRGRANCENRVKEWKYDFAADNFNMTDFWATEAALNTVMLAYKLMSLFGRFCSRRLCSKVTYPRPFSIHCRRFATSYLPSRLTQLPRSESRY